MPSIETTKFNSKNNKKQLKYEFKRITTKKRKKEKQDTQTHKHTYKEREREREKERKKERERERNKGRRRNTCLWNDQRFSMFFELLTVERPFQYSKHLMQKAFYKSRNLLELKLNQLLYLAPQYPFPPLTILLILSFGV